MTARRVVLPLLVGAVAVVAVVGAGATPSASTTIDRTLSCHVGVKGGIRSLDVDARTGYKSGGRLEWLAQMGVSTWRLGKKLPFSVAGVTVGWPPPSEQLRGGLGFSLDLCKASSRRVPLTRRRLTGGPASAWGDAYRCFTPATVFVRIRAQLPEAATLEKRKGWFGAVAHVSRGQVAAATPAGKPVAYGEVHESGKTSLFTARGCR
jgi:hypothetical protein